jgi:hypothetical protein
MSAGLQRREKTMDKAVYGALEAIKDEINDAYGFEGETPRINYGPCGVFAYLFHREWNARFEEKVQICFVFTPDHSECYHVCLQLPTGELYDGGAGIHSAAAYPGFVLERMPVYRQELLEKWSYGLDRTYPRFCPAFSRAFVEGVIVKNLDALRKISALKSASGKEN